MKHVILITMKAEGALCSNSDPQLLILVNVQVQFLKTVLACFFFHLHSVRLGHGTLFPDLGFNSTIDPFRCHSLLNEGFQHFEPLQT